MRAVSLFSNCGAGDVGFKEAGFKFEVMAELDPLRLEVCLLNHRGADGVAGDLRETWPRVVRAYRERVGMESPALLCACPPCQGMSSARSGKGRHDDAAAGSKDARNLLVTVIVNVARELRPQAIVVENVPAFFTRMVNHPVDGLPVSAANYLIEQLTDQYLAFPMVCDLSDFGVPQTRKRAFITLLRRDLPGLKKLQLKGFAPFPRPSTSAPVSIEQSLASLGLPSLDASSEARARVEGYGGMHFVPVWAPRTYEMVAAIKPGTGSSAWMNSDCVSCGQLAINPEAAQCPRCAAPLLRPVVAESGGKYRLIRGFKSSYRRMHPSRPAATITTASGHIGSDYTIHPTENRLLSPMECAHLQTFPPKFRWGKSLQTYGHTRVREMIGEAVPPYFTRQHGRALMRLLQNHVERNFARLSDERCEKGRNYLVRGLKREP